MGIGTLARGACGAGFLAAALTAALTTQTLAQDAPENGLYELRIYTAPEGRLTELSQSFRDKGAALLESHGMTNVGYWLPLDTADERVVFLLSYPDRAARDAAWQALAADPELGELAAMRSESGSTPIAFQTVLLAPTDYSPAPVPPTEDTAHVYEMRTYHAADGRLEALNARFRDHTLGLFETHGIGNVLYFTPLPGQDMPETTLLYFVAFPDADARNAAWRAFLTDPEWQEVAQESERDGPLMSGPPESLMLVPTEYSPLQ